jgi:hypothetical protein
MTRIWLAVLLSIMVPATAWAGEVTLWIVRPAPGADLADCPQRAAAAVEGRSQNARQLTSDAVVHWAAGDHWPERDLPLRGATGAEEDIRTLEDHCFALTINGGVGVSGAILNRHSARLLRFPVLHVTTRKQGLELRFELTPAFPAKYATIPPKTWGELLQSTVATK